MRQVYDIKTTVDTGDQYLGEDLYIDPDTGDFVIEESTVAHQRNLLLNDKGENKENPTACVGAFNYIDDEEVQDFMAEVSQQFTRDGMAIKDARIDSASIATGLVNPFIDAYYK